MRNYSGVNPPIAEHPARCLSEFWKTCLTAPTEGVVLYSIAGDTSQPRCQPKPESATLRCLARHPPGPEYISMNRRQLMHGLGALSIGVATRLRSTVPVASSKGLNIATTQNGAEPLPS